MTSQTLLHNSDATLRASRPFGSYWSITLGIIAAVFLLRIVYLFCLSPWELLGDEAYYWEWSRHLDLCYYEKGPGLAYLIAACTRICGVSEGSVRLSMAVLAAVAAWGLGRLVLSSSDGDVRAAFWSVLCFLLLPAFQANAQICTQDGPLIVCWIALSAAGLRLIRRWHANAVNIWDWTLIGFILGVGFLFKQSVLLFALSPIIYAIIQRRKLVFRPRMLLYASAAGLVFLLTISPIIIWNVRHQWPTLAHTLGHLGVGGDRSSKGEPWFDLRWPLSMVGAQVGAFGPGAIVLMAGACAWAVHSRKNDPERWPTRLWLLCCALPGIGFYFLLSFAKPVLGNWPFPCFITLLVPLGEVASRRLSWQTRCPNAPSPGDTSKGSLPEPKPNRVFRLWWRVMVTYGAIAWLILSFPTVLAYVPFARKIAQKVVLPRMTGHREEARKLQLVRERVLAQTGRTPFVVTRYYMTAALYAFYLPDHPAVFNAGAQLGKRHTAYDYWGETDLAARSLVGRDALLDGVGAYPWARVLRYGAGESIDGGRFTLVHDYAGVQPPTLRLMPDQGMDHEP
ncbi:MAG: glycosyl transferase family 39 [Phycisphaerales bacterium]|nr:glycosyl transferase family 39 [Phycisphaerales bacterium]